MTPIRYVVGDATRPQGDGPKIIAHVCNDAGGWGAGFTGAVSRRWPEPEAAYRKTHRDFGWVLGPVQPVMVEEGLWVVNMVAQHGYSSPGKPSIRYYKLTWAMENLAGLAIRMKSSVHMPRIGTGLAGGDWEQIEPIIEGELCLRGIEVTVYDLP